MKKLATALALSLALAAPTLASAQDGGVAAQPPPCEHGPGMGHGHHGFHRDPARMVEHRLRMMTAILDLDARQQAAVRQILTEASTEMQALHAQGRSESTRAQMDALHDRIEARIDGVLTPAQRVVAQRVRAVHDAERAERRAAHEARRGRGGGR